MTTKWIDAYWANSASEHDGLEVGDVGFFVTITDVMLGTSYSVLQRHPERTNSSREQRLTGWCGTTNDRHVKANGLAKVCRVTHGGRAQVRTLRPAETLEALAALDYEYLAP